MNPWSGGMEEGVEGGVELVALGIVVGLLVELLEHTDVVLDVVRLTCSDTAEEALTGFQVGSQMVGSVAHLAAYLVQDFSEILQRLNCLSHCKN